MNSPGSDFDAWGSRHGRTTVRRPRTAGRSRDSRRRVLKVLLGGAGGAVLGVFGRSGASAQACIATGEACELDQECCGDGGCASCQVGEGNSRVEDCSAGDGGECCEDGFARGSGGTCIAAAPECETDGECPECERCSESVCVADCRNGGAGSCCEADEKCSSGSDIREAAESPSEEPDDDTGGKEESPTDEAGGDIDSLPNTGAGQDSAKSKWSLLALAGAAAAALAGKHLADGQRDEFLDARGES